MHELAIAQSMFEVARRHARGQCVTKVEVRVGHLRQVVPASLAFAFELTAQGTELEKAELEIVQVPAAGTCRDCGCDTPLPDFPLMCSACGGLDVDVTEGEELQVESLELEEPNLLRERPCDSEDEDLSAELSEAVQASLDEAVRTVEGLLDDLVSEHANDREEGLR